MFYIYTFIYLIIIFIIFGVELYITSGCSCCFQAIDGVHACFAMATKYNMINTETGQILDLFPYDEKTTPLVNRITKVMFHFWLSG